MGRLLQEAEEEKQQLQIQLRATEEAWEKMKFNKGLEKPPSSTSEVNNVGNSSISFSHDDDLGVFGKKTTGIGARLMKKMGYEGKGLGANGQSIVNPIQAVGLPRHSGLGYVRKEETEESSCDKSETMKDVESAS